MPTCASRQRASSPRDSTIAFSMSVMPDSAETTISTLRPRAWCSAAMRAIVSQRARGETLVPPNLATIQGLAEVVAAARDTLASVELKRFSLLVRHSRASCEQHPDSKVFVVILAQAGIYFSFQFEDQDGSRPAPG